MNVQGHAALVTGGASGLGEGTARALAAAGAKVAILDVNLEGARRVAADIGGLAVQCDVSSAAAAEGAVAEAKAAHGAARVLVNCAGIAPPARIVGKNGPMPLENFARIIEINLIGTFNMIRLAAADMVDLIPWPMASAAAWCRPLRLPLSRARSGSRPMPPRRAACTR